MMAPTSRRPTNRFGRHPLPTRRPTATVQPSEAPSEAQGSSRPGQAENETSSPPLSREEAASILVAMRTSSNRYYQPPQSQLPQSPEEEVARILLGMKISSNMQTQPPQPDHQSWDARGAPPQTPTTQKRKADEETEGEEEPEAKKPATAKRGMPDPDRPRPFKCFCGKTFVRNEHLVRHRQCKHESERFECDICRVLCTRKDNLKQHRASKHPNAGPQPEPRSVIVVPDGANHS